MKSILLLTHSADSTTGTTTEWCDKHGLAYEVHASPQFFASRISREWDALLIFGGDMEIWETDAYPWLREEKDFIRSFLQSGRPVFGVCLGSQLIAEQLGATVAPQGFWELGWFPVGLANGHELIPLHCHSSRFSLPPGTKRIAKDQSDTNQGFIGPRGTVVGFQFHTEIDQSRIDHITSGLSGEAMGRVQSRDEIIDGFHRYGEALRDWYFAELDRWFSAAALGF